MSHVTDILIWVSFDDVEDPDEIAPAVAELNRYLEDAHGVQMREVGHFAGGNKHPQCLVYAVSVNYLHGQEFLGQFHGVTWVNPGAVRLILQDEHCEEPRVFLPRIMRPLDHDRPGSTLARWYHEDGAGR